MSGKAFLLALSLGLSSLALTSPVRAVEPDEILADPGLEARARMISREIRCTVCQGETIDDSSAPISRDLRLIIRERLVAGDSNDEVIDFLVVRYGEFVLFKPRMRGWDIALWLAGPALFVIAAGGVWLVLRRAQKKGEPQVAALSAEEEARLREILKGE